VAAEKADLGIAWDGDADRCFSWTDTAEFVPGDFVTALLGESFVRREPGAKVVYDVRASRALRDRVQAAGGTALMNRGRARVHQESACATRTPSSGARLGALLLPRQLVRGQRD